MTANRAPPNGTHSSRAKPSPTKAREVADATLSGPRTDDLHELGTSEEIRQPLGSMGKAGGLSSKRLEHHTLLQRVFRGYAYMTVGCPDSAAVAAIEGALEALGHDCGPGRGRFDATTVAAVSTFQTERHLTSHGIVDQMTLMALDEEDARLFRSSRNAPRRSSGGGGGKVTGRQPDEPTQAEVPADSETVDQKGVPQTDDLPVAAAKREDVGMCDTNKLS